MKKCPQCAEQIQSDAKVCRYCGHKFAAGANISGPAGCLVIAILLLVGTCSVVRDDKPEPPAETEDVQQTVDAATRAQQAQTGAGDRPPTKDHPIGSAPPGYPVTVAGTALRATNHPCRKVVAAVRRPADGAIVARCSNHEDYLVFRSLDQGTVVMRCSVVQRLNVDACSQDDVEIQAQLR